MTDWRTIILANFVPGLKPVIAVSDPDQIMREPHLLKLVEERGFTVIFFEEALAFRYDYEERFRRRWDAGEPLEGMVVFTPCENDFETLPVDVLEKSLPVSLHLKDIFPCLSYGVLQQVETTYFDALFAAHNRHASQPQGEDMSKDFMLRYLFEVDGNLIASDASLLCFLCRLHYRRQALPEMLAVHLERLLKERFPEWPLNLLLRHRAAFFAFLQERWPIFLAASDGGRVIFQESHEILFYLGPHLLAFGHDDVRVFIDTFFEDGILSPVAWNWDHAANKTWIRVGLLGTGAQNTELRMKELLKNLPGEIPQAESPPADWLNFAMRWGHTRMLWHDASPRLRKEDNEVFFQLAGLVTKNFDQWLGKMYPGIWTHSASTPVMVHHIPKFLARKISNPSDRVAFLLVDGLAIEQWMAIKTSIQRQLQNVMMEEAALFAWVPSITPVSRQSAFSGKLPLYFPESIAETSKDEARWRQFWSEQGLHPSEVAFIGTRGETGDMVAIEDLIAPETKALGITLYKVDEILHGMQLGAAGMINQVRMWAEGGVLFEIIHMLLTRGFTVVISSDHGNIEATGIGIPNQGVLCDNRGQRCRIFSEESFAEKCVSQVEGSRIWRHAGLPQKFFPVMAPDGKAFLQKGTTAVCHGGVSLEELAVPFIMLQSKVHHE